MLQFDSEQPAANVLWRTRSRPTTTMSTPLMIDDDHFCAIEGAGLGCFDANSGDEVWISTEVAGSGRVGHAPLTPNGVAVTIGPFWDRFVLRKWAPLTLHRVVGAIRLLWVLIWDRFGFCKWPPHPRTRSRSLLGVQKMLPS